MKIEVTENEVIINGNRYVFEQPEEQISNKSIWLQDGEWHIKTWNSDGTCTHEVRLFNGGPEPIIRDPWLVPGQPCEVKGPGGAHVMYFSSYYGVEPEFVDFKNLIGYRHCETGAFHYRPIGTIWDHLPDSIIGIAKDEDGTWNGHRKKPFLKAHIWESDLPALYIDKGSIPFDRCWKESWTPRPEWAGSEE
jgi:hypothetical protein